MKMAVTKTKPAGAAKKSREGGVKVKQTRSGEKIIREKKAAPAEDVKEAKAHAKKEAQSEVKKPEEAAEEKKAGKPEKKAEEVRKEKPIVKVKHFAEGKIKVARKGKPRFTRYELYKCKKLKDVWRTPKGMDGKKKEGKRGKGAMPSIGYRNPGGSYGVIKGFKAVQVSGLGGFEGIDHTTQAIVISACIGRKKRNVIIEEANKRKIVVLNPRKGEL